MKRIDSTLALGSRGVVEVRDRKDVQPGTVVGIGPSRPAPSPAPPTPPAPTALVPRRARAADPAADTAAADQAVTLETALADTLERVSPASLGGRGTVLPKLTLDAAGAGPVLTPDERPRYKELRRLGEGGVGEVTLAEDADIGRHVAIKRLHDESERGHVMRFVEEVRVLGALDHPNIVPVHDVGCDAEGHLYFVMKRVEGDTLESILQRLRDGDAATHRRYPIPVRVEIFLGILRAVQFAHAQRVIHRDIKPANVMIGEFGEVVVMDWGIARRLGDPVSSALDAAAPVPDELPAHHVGRRPFQTRVGTLLGTPAYMSPEQARGDNHLLDERSDVYALAVLFYEWLTLRHYLEGIDDLFQLLEAVRTRDATPAAFLRSPYQGGISMELTAFLRTGMAKQREDRFQSVTEMIDELHHVLAGTFAVSCPITLTKRTLFALARRVDAHPKATMLTVMAGALASAAGLVLAVLSVVR